MKKIKFAIIVVSIIPVVTLAHPGRTDSSGCHTCRTNCSSWGLSSGEYHCHQSKGVAQPVGPIKSIRNQNGPGKTIPAPEYKVPKTTPVNNTFTTTNTTSPPSTERRGLIKSFFNWLF